MSYEKHTWQTGETITAEKLNNLENGAASGGGAGAFIVKFTMDMQTGEPTSADKTLEEIYQACKDGENVIGWVSHQIEEGEDIEEIFSYMPLKVFSYEKSNNYEGISATFESHVANNIKDGSTLCDIDAHVITYTSENGVVSIDKAIYLNQSVGNQ